MIKMARYRWVLTSYWFSHEITRHEFPWVFERGDKPSLLISSLASLAVLIALQLFFPLDSEHSKKKISVIPTWTDNRGERVGIEQIDVNPLPV